MAPTPAGPAGEEPQPDPDPPADRLLTTAQVAEILGGGITAGTVARRHRSWGLRACKVGRELRFWESAVYAWIEEHSH